MLRRSLHVRPLRILQIPQQRWEFVYLHAFHGLAIDFSGNGK